MITNFLGKGVFLAASTACCSWHPRLIRTKLLVTLGSLSGASHHTDYFRNNIFHLYFMKATVAHWEKRHYLVEESVYRLFSLRMDIWCWGSSWPWAESKAVKSNQIPQYKQLTSFLPIHTLKLFKAESTLPPYFTAFRCPLVKANSFSRHHLVPCFCSFFDYVQLFFQQEIFAL